MRNRKRLLQSLGASTAIIATLMTVTAQANAVPRWSPAFTTATSGNIGSLWVDSPAGSVQCGNGNMTMRTAADGITATTQPPAGGGVTFSNCWGSGLYSGISVTAAMTGQWTIRPTSTTTANVELPANSLTITVGPSGWACKITVGPAGPVTLPAVWQNGIHKLSLQPSTVPVSAVGSLCSGSTRTIGNYLSGDGWVFPTLSILP